MGSEGRKQSAEIGSRIPRPGGTARSKINKTMTGVAPAANPPPQPVPDALSGHDDAATAHGLSPEMGRALAQLAKERAPESAAPVSSGVPVSVAPPVSRGPASVAPATTRMSEAPKAGSIPPRSGMAPVAPRAPSLAPSAPSAPRSAPSLAPSVPSAPRSAPLVSPSSSPTSAPSLSPVFESYAPPATVRTPSTDPMAAPLSPLRTPGPMAVVGGGAVRAHGPVSPLPMPASFKAPAFDAPAFSAPPMNAPMVMPSTPKAFAPAVSVPHGSSSGGHDEPAALTYQVYTPETAPAPRSMQPSRASFPDATPKSSLRFRIGLAATAACVVLATTALIIVGASDDPPRSAQGAQGKSASVAGGANATSSPAMPPALVSAPVPEPPPVIAAVAAQPIPDPPAPPVKPAKKAKGASSAAPALRGVAIPPNPFGASGSPAKPAAKKK